MAVFVPTSPPRVFESDERQREAIEHLHGPMLVVAGAGTGKTTVLTRRIARLVREGHARPSEILAVTYTKNSAQEMRGRVQGELRGTDLTGLQVATFHEYCNNLLIRNDRQFGLLDDKDLWIYLRKRIRELHLNYFVRAANVGKFLNDLLDFMRRCQDELVGPEKYATYVQQLETGELPVPRVSKSKDMDALSTEEVLGRCREIANVFSTVEKMLREENLGTFGHMITHAHALLHQDAAQLSQARQQTRFILVDEFQDANFAQVKILQMLAGDERNVFAVGDPDQAIYQFRGASSAAFELFRRHFPGAKLVVLEKNRRSTTPVLRCAYTLIAKNPEIFPRSPITAMLYRRSPLVSARDEDSLREGREPLNTPVEAALSVGKEVESSDVAMTIRRLRRESRCKWKQIAVLYRLHTHRDEVAAELAEQGIPFSIENMDVMDTPETRDLFACLGAVVSERDGASLFRVAALPQFVIDPQKLRSGMRSLPRNSTEVGVASVLAQVEGGSAVLESLRQTREEITGAGPKSRSAAEIVIRRFGLDRTSRPLQAVLDFITCWEAKAITKTGELGEFLEYLDYFREAAGTIPMTSQDEDAVSLMTAHTAKGLEWDHVLVLRANSGSFPWSYKQPLVEFPAELRDDYSFSPGESKALHDEEERRLFYVAMTRARDSLTIYSRQGKGKNITPPGYMRELLLDASLSRWLRRREAQAVAGELFAQATANPALASRNTEWLQMTPDANLNEKLSATAVETYETCPLQFKLEREWKIPREVPAALQYGAAMHRVLRTYYDSVRLRRTIADDDLIALFYADLADAGIQEHYQHDLYEKQGAEQLRDFLAASGRAAPVEVLHTEEWFEVKIGGATVTGRIDRMDRRGDGSVVITDYKTGKPKSQEDADDSLQLSIYAMAAREKWGYDVDSLVLYNLEENSAVVTRRGDAQLQQVKRKVEDVALQIVEGNFTAKTGFHCNFCPYRNLCPATEKKVYSVSAEGSAGRAAKRSPRS
jgi:DNA helicase-2/ATP-dependent DNA helicase PcrA